MSPSSQTSNKVCHTHTQAHTGTQVPACVHGALRLGIFGRGVLDLPCLVYRGSERGQEAGPYVDLQSEAKGMQSWPGTEGGCDPPRSGLLTNLEDGAGLAWNTD